MNDFVICFQIETIVVDRSANLSLLSVTDLFVHSIPRGDTLLSLFKERKQNGFHSHSHSFILICSLLCIVVQIPRKKFINILKKNKVLFFYFNFIFFIFFIFFRSY
jgi:hypothetical protein